MSQVEREPGSVAPDFQQRRLRELLVHVWRNSPFYRDYYRNHGVRERNLADLTIRDLPFITKKVLMENLDEAVTDRRLGKKEIERWIQEKSDPRETIYKDFIVFSTSGSSGHIGRFIYDRIAWRVLGAAMANRLPRPENYPSGRSRVAYYVASAGMGGSVTVASQMPKAIYDVSVFSLLDPLEQVIARLNAFGPHRLVGYSSGVASLAELQIADKLRISPRRVCVTGDTLTKSLRQKIDRAWAAPLDVFYCCSESIYVAVQEWGEVEMTVMDDLNILEALDEHDQPVPPGSEGRVVLTNLYNYALPVLRYELGDYVVRGAGRGDSLFSTIREVRGRAHDRLPVVLSNNEQDYLHPLVLVEFYVAGLEKVQFTSLRPDSVQIDYVAQTNIDSAVRKAFQWLLDRKGASMTRFNVRQVNHIPNDERTGKLQLVKVTRG
jgi:phenylacetate-CoA ligase